MLWIALIVSTGVIAGVAWLAASVPSCMRCWQRARQSPADTDLPLATPSDPPSRS